MYDPTVGQWISEDPIGFGAMDSNLRRYVANGPTSHTDPTGLAPADDVRAIPPSALNRRILVTNVTSANLTWDLFETVRRPPPGALRRATSVYQFESSAYDYRIDMVTLSAPPSARCFSVLAFTRLRNHSFGVAFAQERSWVLEGEDTAALLEHERLHLRIAEYFAAYATQRASRAIGEGVGTAETYEEAKAIAIERAKTSLDAQRAFHFQTLQAKDKEAQREYDDRTEGGDLTDKQADWSTNWQRYIREFLW